MMGPMLRLGFMLTFCVALPLLANAEQIDLPSMVNNTSEPATAETIPAAAGSEEMNAEQVKPTEENQAQLQAILNLPDKGVTKDSVDKTYGHPKQTIPPVGHPPIERWIYDEFTVYFENQTEIHSVAHNQYEQKNQ